MTYEDLEDRLAEWASNEPSVRAVVTVGSRARGTADAWSDLDVLILTTERARLAAEPSWLSALGEAWLTYLDHTDPGDPEWFVLYDDGLKMDAVLLSVAEPWHDLEALLAQYPYQGVLSRGAAILFDRRGVARSIPPTAPAMSTPPIAAEFANVVQGLLLECVTTARFIGRGDLLRAQLWLARDLRPRLITLAEWHGRGKDTWYDGRFLDQWADPRLLAVVGGSFTPPERAPMMRVVLSVLDVCRALGEETAGRLGYEYPSIAHDRTVALVASTFG